MQTHSGAFAPFAAEIARSRLFVGYDSAAGHVASACGVPLISIATGFATERMAARSFSIIKVPYSFKLLMQELQVMNVQMRIITEDNVDQLLSMSYSDNINKLMKSNKTTSEVIGEYGAAIKAKMAEDFKEAKRVIPQEQPVIPEPAVIESTPVTPE